MFWIEGQPLLSMQSRLFSQKRKTLTKRSSRVIPGFLGTPAGMMTSSAPVKASLMLVPLAKSFLSQKKHRLRHSTAREHGYHSLVLLETLDDRVGVDVRNVGSDTGGTSDIVQGKTSDERVSLEEERHRLADTTCNPLALAIYSRYMNTQKQIEETTHTGSTEDGDLPLRTGRRGKASGEEAGGSSDGSREHCS